MKLSMLALIQRLWLFFSGDSYGMQTSLLPDSTLRRTRDRMLEDSAFRLRPAAANVSSTPMTAQ